MQMTETDEVGEVLSRVSTWPAEKRLVLTQKILQTLTRDLSMKPQPQKTLKDLLGLLKTEGPTPSDEECKRFLEEELLRKHGS